VGEDLGRYEEAAMATVEKLVTAEQFLESADDGRCRELVGGRIVVMNVPGFRHGEICSNIVHHLGSFVRQNELGRVLSNDSGIVTARDPDTVRGADVAYYSFARVPQESRPAGYPDVAPEMVFEVTSPGDRWAEITGKVSEYLGAGVLVVCVVDPKSRTVVAHYAERSPDKFREDDEFQIPGILPGWRIAVRSLFA
jgi:Uma2 family endonuclease